jgi:predicted esterase
LHEARARAWRGDWPAAAACQYWAFAKRGTDPYDLACYLARMKQVDAAFYWLQVAARDDGVDAAWAGQDDDLSALHRDPRWEQVQAYLNECDSYWKTHGKPLTVVLRPAGHEPVATLVWLHPATGHPDPRSDPAFADVQALLDRNQFALVGVSGSFALGKAKYTWSHNTGRDAQRVEEALREAARELKLRPETTVLFGLAQGGQVALETLARNPGAFAGAIAVTPASREWTQLEKAKSSPLLARREVVIVLGERENQPRRQLGRLDERWFRKAGSSVRLRDHPELPRNDLPPEFDAQLGTWVKEIVAAAATGPVGGGR